MFGLQVFHATQERKRSPTCLPHLLSLREQQALIRTVETTHWVWILLMLGDFSYLDKQLAVIYTKLLFIHKQLFIHKTRNNTTFHVGLLNKPAKKKKKRKNLIFFSLEVPMHRISRFKTCLPRSHISSYLHEALPQTWKHQFPLQTTNFMTIYLPTRSS